MEKKAKEKRFLVFLTSGFPYGTGEPFIENEIYYLTQRFHKMVILTPAGIANQEKRPIPKNVKILQIDKSEKIPARFSSLISQSFWQGLKQDLIRKNKQANCFQIFRTCWSSFSKAFVISKCIGHSLAVFNFNPDETILYSFWLDEKAIGLALIKKKYPGIKTVSRAHGWDVFEERHQPPFLPFRPWLFKTLDLVAVVSQKGSNYLNKQFDPSKGKVAASYLGTEPLNEKRKIKKNKYSIVSCSSLISIKRVELIIEALSLLNFSLCWTHIGDGPLKDELEKRATKNFEGKNIDFRFAGQFTNKQVREFYENIHVDLFISTSETEGLPVSMMEVQSAGTPILATDVGGVNEIVIDGVTGWLLPPKPSAIEAAQKITEIFNFPETEILRIRENAFSHWKRHFNAKENYFDFIKMLESL